MNIGLADKNNRWATIIFGAIAGLAGSATTIITAGSAVWAIISVLTGRFRLSLDRPTVLLSLAALFYVLASVFSAMLNLPGSDISFGKTLARLASLTLFLSPLFLVSRLRLSKPEDLLSAFVLGASLCGILVLPLAAYQTLHLGLRAEGGAGNSIPFAMLCALFSTISLLSGHDAQIWRKVLGWLGFACGTFAAFLSQTKGVAPLPLMGAVVYLLAFRRRDLGLGRIVLVLALICAAMFAAFQVSGIANRFEATPELIFGAVAQTTDGANFPAKVVGTSSGERIELWKGGLKLVAEHPIFGSGPQNIRSLIEEMGRSYTHFHNGYLTAMVGGGLLGLVALLCLMFAPLVLSYQARDTSNGAFRLYIAAMLVLTYAVGGMTNFIFGHDIYDSVFLFTASLCIASIGAGRPEPLQG